MSKQITLLFLACALFVSCRKNDATVKFVRIVDEYKKAIVPEDGDSYEYPFTVTVDVPVEGPRVLRDSVWLFLNKSLHEAFELVCNDDDSQILELEQVKTNDSEGIVKHFIDSYKPYLNQFLSNTYSLTATAVAQTESFVTYAVEFHHCGASCGAELYCSTFNKKNGRICQIIEYDMLTEYVEDKQHDGADYPYGDFHDRFSFGLLEDGLLEVVQDAGNHHYTADYIELEEIHAYLSKEALNLIDKAGDPYQHEFDDWSLGMRIGEAETVDGKTVALMQKVPRWRCFEEVHIDDLYSEELSVFPYLIENGRYSQHYGDDYETLAFIGKTEDYLIRIDNISNTYRYSSWKRKFNMLDEADIVIDKGRFDYADAAYVFENAGYEYDVAVNGGASSLLSFSLLVLQGDRTILNQSGSILEESALADISYVDLGRVTGKDGETVHIIECTDAYYGASTSYDYYVKTETAGNHPVKKQIFEKETPAGEVYYQAYSDTVSSYSRWLTTDPHGRYHAFNSEDNTLYCACGDDRFDIYQFDGTRFMFLREDGGFWLHPSIRTFSRLVNVYETTNYTIRVDQLDDNSYRYASWKKKKGAKSDMSATPDLIVNRGESHTEFLHSGHEYNVSRFENNGYTYSIDESKRELSVTKGQKVILTQRIESSLSN